MKTALRIKDQKDFQEIVESMRPEELKECAAVPIFIDWDTGPMVRGEVLKCSAIFAFIVTEMNYCDVPGILLKNGAALNRHESAMKLICDPQDFFECLIVLVKAGWFEWFEYTAE